MHKKAPGFTDANPFFENNYLHTSWLTGTSLVAIKWLLSGFCLATDTIKVLSSWLDVCTLSRGIYKMPPAPNTGNARMSVCEWLTAVLWESGEGFERRGGPVQSQSGEAPRPQQLPPFWQHKTKQKKGSLCTSPASRPPSPPRRRALRAPDRSPPSSAPLFLSTAVCSARQNNMRQGPGPVVQTTLGWLFFPANHIPRQPSDKRGWDF